MERSDNTVAATNGRAVIHDRTERTEQQAHVDGAFEFDNNNAGILQRLQAETDRVVVQTELVMTGEHERLIREKTLYLIPARNEEHRVHRVLLYLLKQLGIPPEHIFVSNASTDKTDEVVKGFGVDVRHQNDVLPQLLDVPRFLEFMRANGLKEIAGKGQTLLAGMLHLIASGKLNKINAADMHVAMLDSDPHHYGIDDYDPIGNFAEMRLHHGAQTMKPAKNGKSRNNQPVYMATDALGMLSPYARSVSGYLGSQPWLLSGEMQRAGDAMGEIVLATGYPVETTMNISDHDLQLRARHYADHQRRGDIDNDLEKETIMYGMITRTMIAIYLHEMETRKRLVDCGITDIASLNERIQSKDERGLPMPYYLRDERNDIPNAPRVIQPQHSRIIGSINMLARSGIAKVDPI